ncbi:hypothetical protein EHS39_30085 [Ensifer sp. MPMI2T]|nr:hypothetical protein EHS39_30085 [Ensifer sp. MPMI2T]
MSCPDCDYIGVGDVVEHKMNTNVFGIVIGVAGSLIYIRSSPSLAVLAFHEWELQVVENEDEPPTKAKEPDPTGNVIKVDFTKPRTLLPSDDTEGAA